MDSSLIDISRLQFAVTALYHFLFVPLTLGMVWLLVIMEAAWLLTGRIVYQDMTKFWGKLFGINFALGVTTGITMEFQFGTNWAYYSHYVGDIFGAPLAIEGLMAFFLESTFIGLFFFGWEKLSKPKHFMVTLMMAVGSNLSALWILIANGWMQDPVGALFNPDTMRMELTSFSAVIFNPTAQAKFVHTVSAGYVTGAAFVMGISAWYLLKRRDVDFARRSFQIAAAFGFLSAASVIILGDESGYAVSESQQSKLAAIEAMWETEPAPAGFNLLAWPNESAQRNDFAITLPYVMGLIGTRSTDKTLLGIKEIRAQNKARILRGKEAVIALEMVRHDPNNTAAREKLKQYQADLGFGLLLKKYVTDVRLATDAMVQQAAHDTVPRVFPLFISFRLMVALGVNFLLLFVCATYFSRHDDFYHQHPFILKWALFNLPLPWLAAELGWFVAEYGRQPWTIYGVLPTHLSASSLTVQDVMGSLAGFVIFYSGLLVVEMYLMIKYAKLGPQSLSNGRYPTVGEA